MKNSNSILIIGGSGFIGRNLIDFYKIKKNTIYYYGSKIDDKYSNLFYLGKYSDKTKFDFIEDNFIIFYLIGGTYKQEKDIEIEFKFIENIFEQINQYKKITFTFFSSAGGIYANSKKIKKENSSLSPNNNYEKNKIKLENYILKSNYTNFNKLILRPSNIYGKYQEKLVNINGLITTLIFNAIKSKKTFIPSNYNNLYRDYLHIDDLINFINGLISTNSSGIYNLSYGKSFNINQILDILNEQKIHPKLKYKGEAINNFSFISNKKAIKDSKYSPKVDIKTGINKMIKYINEQ